jgi:hypothetical protein
MQYTAQVDLAPNYATRPRQAYVCPLMLANVFEHATTCTAMGLVSGPTTWAWRTQAQPFVVQYVSKLKPFPESQ